MRVETPPDSAPGIPGADVGPAASDGDADSVIGVSGPKSVEDRAATDVETGHTADIPLLFICITSYWYKYQASTLGKPRETDPPETGGR